LKKKEDFICFQKVTLAVSKVRHLPHLPPLRYGHALFQNLKSLLKNYVTIIFVQET
jgi:hypothetical protein